jgi:hypothetical protein
MKGEIRYNHEKELCLSVAAPGSKFGNKSGFSLSIDYCDDSLRQKFTFDKEGTRQINSNASKSRCITLSDEKDKNQMPRVSLDNCDDSLENQKWQFRNYDN